MIKISIIVPVYNVEEYLERCLNSLVNQTMEEIEIIVVNDGTKDNSQEIINKYQHEHNNIVSYIKENGGLSDARNYGLNRAKGEYIMFVDSDDFIETRSCEELYEKISNNKLDMLKFNYYDEKNNKNGFSEELNYLNKIYTGEEYLQKVLMQGEISIVAWNAIYKREYLQKNNFLFKKGILHEDELWTPQVILKTNKIMQVPEKYYYYKANPTSITAKKDKTKNALDIIDTCYTLEKIYQNISDKQLKSMLENTLVTKYLEAFVMGEIYRKETSKYINKRFLLGKSYTLKNKLKVMLFFISTKLYYKLNILKNRER